MLCEAELKKKKTVMSEHSFKRCVPPCERYITPSDSHELCVVCLGAQHARSALEGAGCAHCDRFSVKQLRSRLALFTEDGSQASAPRGAGPAAAEAEHRLHSWGSQLNLADELGTGLSLSQSSVASSVALEPNLEATSQTASSSSPTYGELLDVMTRATARLTLDWSAEVQERVSSSRLDERFLAGHKHSAPPSLPFLPELHSELLRSWRNPFSARVFPPSKSNYTNVKGLEDSGYTKMPRMEESLAGYLAAPLASSWRAPTLPSKPCQFTSRLVGKAYAVAGQAGGTLHTISVLQAYQADLLRDADAAGGVAPDEIEELRRSCDLALRATKQAARTIGRSLAALVVTERHLWLNLSGLKEKDRSFLLDASVSPAGLFGAAVETVVRKFREAKVKSAAFEHYIPRRRRRPSGQPPEAEPAAGPSWRPSQKASIAARAPPPRGRGSRQQSRVRQRQDLREVIDAKKGKSKP